MNLPINPTINPYTHPQVGESPQIENLQTELKYLDSFKFYYILPDLGGPPLWVGGLGGCGCG